MIEKGTCVSVICVEEVEEERGIIRGGVIEEEFLKLE
jgi:hypothetical protein